MNFTPVYQNYGHFKLKLSFLLHFHHIFEQKNQHVSFGTTKQIRLRLNK